MKVTFCFFLLIFLTDANVNCPSYCRCEMVENLRGALCTKKNLVVVQIDVPPQVELLDVSFNQISELQDKTFLEMQLTSLKMFNASYNKIGDVHMNAFEGLTKLKTMDLSHNALRYLLGQWFLSLPALQELYLRGNHLAKEINNAQQIIDSKSLKILDISKCSITYLRPTVFSKTPNLEVLDISENSLKQVSVDVVSPLSYLTILNAQNNTFVCSLEKNIILRNYTRNQGVRYGDPCPQIKHTNKSVEFERMINDVPMTIERNFWLYDEEEEVEEKTNSTNGCDNSTTRVVRRSLLEEIIDLSPVLSIIITLTTGFLLGLIIGCAVQITKKEKIINFPRRNSFRRRIGSRISLPRRHDDNFQSLMLSESMQHESTPMTQRKIIVSV